MPYQVLERIDKAHHVFVVPSKKIHDGNDVQTFFTTKAYRDIMAFLLQLNRAIFPRKIDNTVQTWQLNSLEVEYSEPTRRIQLLLSRLESIIDEVPPDTGPRRFGNISFRKWHQIVEERLAGFLDEALGTEVLENSQDSSAQNVTSRQELQAYLLGSFGSAQRLDYGTGHELSFLAFLACLWKLSVFPETGPGVEERGIVIGIIEPYLDLVRNLIKTYTLEPAGTHGVWGLDDHFFLPYIFGSAQYSPAIAETDETPVEGSLSDAPAPTSVVKNNIVERERRKNMYFSAIGFIYDVKKGPFWEHSPMLFDISGVTGGWGKINKGMIKMYNAEVLSKFPVVQHFPFGSLFSWDRDPSAISSLPSIYSQQANTSTISPSVTSQPASTRAPWSQPSTSLPGATAVPWATNTARNPQVSTNDTPSATRTPFQNTLPATSRNPPDLMAPTRAPWAKPS
ncbi:phosphotyrosyl phosphatase activator [Talaromyces stipitatus ATCC 10500]|uniref:Serine/threonine-protein phosphatase 2A activator n=1 Tax=Talaromyces stipitatus (strain ATCC 10500 / CBS 375.48 / QM 6759 / NRRL 1006) TaxID=441959 RepID=B8M089_TALSN|nr:phosphotyrosyl phosphatase activator [Talaromyces stipitatus ATCC 10500]EED21186.1 phosphotyrosyl phosphatase activator [Talaromyces stipitatus ATCC 10500]